MMSKQSRFPIIVGNLRYAPFQELTGKKRWRWRVKHKNGKTVSTSGQSFASKGNAERAIDDYLANHEPMDKFEDGQ